MKKDKKTIILKHPLVWIIAFVLAFPIDIIGNYGLQFATYNPDTRDLDIVRDLSFPCDRDAVEAKVTALREKHGK